MKKHIINLLFLLCLVSPTLSLGAAKEERAKFYDECERLFGKEIMAALPKDIHEALPDEIIKVFLSAKGENQIRD